MKTNLAKPVLYVLIGSACAYALLFVGELVQPLTGFRSFGFIIDGLLGLLSIGTALLGLALAAFIAVAILGAIYELGKWIMEKLL